MSLYFSLISKALLNISWVKLEDYFEARGFIGRLEFIRDNLPRLVAGSAVLRLACILAALVSILYWQSLPSNKLTTRSLVSSCLISGLLLSVFTVAIPNAWARYCGTWVVVHCYSVIVWVDRILRPLTAILQLPDPVIRRLSGAAREGAAQKLEEQQEELLNVVEEGEKAGVVDEEERDMIESVLEFRNLTVDEIMTPRIEVVGIDCKLEFAAVVDLIVKEGHSRYPVYEESIDHIIGILYVKDLLGDLNRPQEEMDIRSRLREPFFVPETKCLRDLLHNFQDQKVHVATVQDEYGGTAGLVTFEDILEELVGEIVDEHEPPRTEPIKEVTPNTLEVDARHEVDKLNDEYELDVPEDDDYETIGGFVFARLGHIPDIGENITYKNLVLTIIDADQRKIKRLRIVIGPQIPAGDGNE